MIDITFAQRLHSTSITVQPHTSSILKSNMLTHTPCTGMAILSGTMQVKTRSQDLKYTINENTFITAMSSQKKKKHLRTQSHWAAQEL